MNTTNQNKTNPTAKRTFTSTCLASCQKLVAQIEQARHAILSEFRDTLAAHEHLVRLAVNEAEALAWQTGFPHLFFPTLATEKLREVATWGARQQSIRRTESSLARAA